MRDCPMKKCKDILRRCALLVLTAALFLPIAGEMVEANTTEAAVTKMYYLFSCGLSKEEIKEKMSQDLRGELSC